MPKISPEEWQRISDTVNPRDDEGVSVVWHKIRGRWFRSVHVFQRTPSTKEIAQFENTASRLKFKGTKAEVEGSQITAAVKLYDTLIDRVYDLPKQNGMGVVADLLPRERAAELVPPMVKREALRDFTGEVYSASRMAEDEEDESLKEED